MWDLATLGGVTCVISPVLEPTPREMPEPLAGAQPILQQFFLSSLVFPEQSEQLGRREGSINQALYHRHCCSSARAG